MATSKLKLLCINQLNDDCLEAIFRILPLQTTVCARIVCQRWKVVIEVKICYSQKSLMLFNSFNDILRYGYFLNHSNCSTTEPDSDYRYDESKDLVMPGGLSLKKCQFLLDLFPKVKILFLFYTKFGSTADLVHLITGWNDNLQSLVMVHSHRSTDLAKAFAKIDLLSLPELKRLTIMGDGKYLLKYSIRIPNAIGGVEDLSLGQYTGHIEPVLKQIGPNIKKLRLNSVKFPLKTLENLVFAKPFLKNRLSHLTINEAKASSGVSQQIWNFICANFQSLTYLDITAPSQNNIVDLVPNLSTLKHLTDLRLRKPKDRIYLTTIKKAQLNLAYSPLETIKVFHLYHDLIAKQIPLMARLLPNVEYLVFNTELKCVGKSKLPSKCTCSKCSQKNRLITQLRSRFAKLRSVKFAVPKVEDALQFGRFREKYEKTLKNKPSPNYTNDDDLWSAMWADPFTDDPNEDHGYEQTVEDQQYVFMEDFYYEVGDRPTKAFWTSSRNTGWHRDHSGESLDAFEQILRDNPDIPHLHFKF